MEPAPEAGGTGVGLGSEGIHSEAAQARVGGGAAHAIPETVGDGWAEDGVHVRVRAKVVARTRRPVNALGHEGETRDVVR